MKFLGKSDPFFQQPLSGRVTLWVKALYLNRRDPGLIPGLGTQPPYDGVRNPTSLRRSA